ncbi:MAG: PEGA domain-containing protein, partial [Candidatus Binatia bacterium]
MTIATIILATTGILYVLGYRLDNSFELARGGLVKLDSWPQNVDITIDSVAVNRTPHQRNVAAGEHTVSYAREGYQGWQKTVEVRPGAVLWLNYARLVPTSITTTVLDRLPAVHQTSTSPDREWYVVHDTAASPAFRLVDVRNEDDIKIGTLNIPATAYKTEPQATHSFDIIAWDVDSDYLLVRHRTGAAVEYLRVPRDDPAETVNISQLYKLDLRSVQFASDTAG